MLNQAGACCRVERDGALERGRSFRPRSARLERQRQMIPAIGMTGIDRHGRAGVSFGAVAIADLKAEDRQIRGDVRLVRVDVKQRLIGLERLLQLAVRLQANGKPELCARIGVRRCHDALSTALRC